MATIEKEKALDVVRQMVADGQVSQEVAEKYFPELKNEDERIRAFLHHTFTKQYLASDKLGKWHGEPVTNILAWLEKKELKKIEEEINGEDYGIDSLYHAQRILEKTLGSVDGYQSDDGILEHKCAISAVKKLYEQKPAWNEEDEKQARQIERIVHDDGCTQKLQKQIAGWFKSLKDRYTWRPSDLPHWEKSTLPNDSTTGFNSDYFCHNGYCINYKELFEKLPKDD